MRRMTHQDVISGIDQAVARTACKLAIDGINRIANEESVSLVVAARLFKLRSPKLSFEVMEQIGSWPSSDPELRALQEVWP